MKFYKRLSLFLSMGIMGIGLITFSMEGPFVSADETIGTVQKKEESHLPDVAVLQQSGAEGEPIQIPSPVPSPLPTPTQTPTPTPIPPNNLLKDEYPKINQLVEAYYNAKLEGSKEAFEPLVSDISKVNIETLQKRTEYIKDYVDLEVYTKRGNDEIDLVVYVCYSVLITTIQTPGVSCDEIYIKYDDAGVPRIYLGDLSKKTEKYLNELREKDDVKKLYGKVNKQMKKSVESDEELGNFLKNLRKVEDVDKKKK